jgi:hypothetical protein
VIATLKLHLDALARAARSAFAAIGITGALVAAIGMALAAAGFVIGERELRRRRA